jgi:hypothetical protein
MKNTDKTPIKTYSKKELRLLYNLSEDVFRGWLNRIKDKIPHYDPTCKLLSPLQVEAIFKHYGEP